MQSLFIGFINDTADPAVKSIAIRVAYLLSARFRLAGNIPHYYTLCEDMHRISFENKLKYIDDRFKEEKNGESLYIKYRDFENSYKKNKSNYREYIVAKKSIEKNAEEIFKVLVDKIADTLRMAGLTDLEPIQETTAYAEYFINYNNAEKQVNGCSKLSDLLTFKLNEEDNEHPTVFVLNNQFFSPAFDTADDEIPRLNTFSDKGFLQEICTCPDYRVLSAADLDTLRFEMGADIENFQNTVNNFLKLNANPRDAFNYLQNDVSAAANKLTSNIRESAIMGQYKNSIEGSEDAGSVLLGMIPLALVFKYFEFIKASLPDTIEIIRQVPEETARKWVPVMIVAVKETAADEIKAENSVTVRKTLFID